MIDLTAIFGNYIKVYTQPRISEIQFTGFPGANGVTAMQLGTRGKPIVITGTLYGSSTDYDASRAALDAIIASIEAYLMIAADDYTFANETYSQVVFTRFEIIPDAEGKAYHMTADSVLVKFIMQGHMLQ